MKIHVCSNGKQNQLGEKHNKVLCMVNVHFKSSTFYTYVTELNECKT